MMFGRIAVLVICAVFFVCSLVGATESVLAGKAKSWQQIEKLSVNVPQMVDEEAQVAIIDKLTSLETLRFVYLDLTINYPLGKSNSRPYAVTRHGHSLDADPDGMGLGALAMGKGMVYWLGPIANNNHLVISVYTGDRSDFPYNDVYREYTGSGEEVGFHVRGFFHVVGNSIPTAKGLQLRPINPPFEVVRKTLGR